MHVMKTVSNSESNATTHLGLSSPNSKLISLRSQRAFLLIVITLIGCAIAYAAETDKGAPQRPFTVADDIGLARFDDPLAGMPPIVLSPDGQFAAVRIQRGLLEQNRLEDELRVYDLAVLNDFVNASRAIATPQPIWSLREATYSEGVLISNVRWTRDSKGLTFLLKDSKGKCQLMYTDLKQSQPKRLSSNGQDVMAFDVRDEAHYAYTIRSTDLLRRPDKERVLPAVDVTGRSFTSVLFPDYEAAWDDRSELWAAAGGSLRPVLSSDTSRPIILYDEGQQSLALSPDGNTLATSLPVAEVPLAWQALYGSAKQSDSYRIQAGSQSLDANAGGALVSRYVTIDLDSGKIHPVVDAPTGRSAHWIAGGQASMAWSANGRLLALPSTFVPMGKSQNRADTPCLAVVDVTIGSIQCLESIKSPHIENGSPNPDYFFIDRLIFHGSSLVMHYRRYSQEKGVQAFSESTAGRWIKGSAKDAGENKPDVDLSIHEGLNEPPVLTAVNPKTRSSRTVWDPNPQIQSINLSAADVYHWKDDAGHDWVGGLYKPANYEPGRRYPLVLQTHGFTDSAFLPSGTMSTAFAARALAATGMFVLQVKGCPIHLTLTSAEAACNVHGYEAAVKQLDAQGLIDHERIGIIGFSRTCYYIMKALIASPLHFSAASITDGVNYGYWQYLLAVDLNGSGSEAERIYKAKPFGEGLQHWTENSPEFNLQKINTPLMIVGEGEASLLSMWEPYAGLRYMNKPTDLVLLHTDEHILTNPAVRMASQGGSVDWFRFWLQGYEDPVPTKAEQYRRWEGLCDMQKTENPNEPTYCISSRH